MENAEQVKGYQEVIAANRPFISLMENADFQEWRKTAVVARMDGIRDALLATDRTAPGWRDRVCDLLIAYQEAKTTYEALFVLVEQTVTVAREEIAKLSEARP